MEKEHHEIHYFHISHVAELYITMAIRSLALSMISLFIPLILLELGRSLLEVMYTVVRASNTLTSYVSGKYLDSHDSKKCLKQEQVLMQYLWIFAHLFHLEQ